MSEDDMAHVAAINAWAQGHRHLLENIRLWGAYEVDDSAFHRDYGPENLMTAPEVYAVGCLLLGAGAFALAVLGMRRWAA